MSKPFKSTILAGALCALTLTGCQTTNGTSDLFSGENIGMVLGAAGGALLGSQFGGGKGQLAMVALGTLGGAWAGSAIGKSMTEGDQIAMNDKTQSVLNEKEEPFSNTRYSTWSNPETGTSGSVEVTNATTQQTQLAMPKLVEEKETYVFAPMQVESGQYVTTKSMNVRAGATTNARVITGLSKGEQVDAIGRTDNGWLLVAKNGRTLGYAYAPLLEKISDSSDLTNKSQEIDTVAVQTDCKDVKRTVRLKDGTQESRTETFCKTPSGWELTS